MVLTILLKKNYLRIDVGIKIVIEVTAIDGYPMEEYASREPFGFVMGGYFHISEVGFALFLIRKDEFLETIVRILLDGNGSN